MCIPTRRRAKHYCSDEKRRNNVEKKKGKKKQLLYKGRALFPPPLSIIQGTSDSFMPLECKEDHKSHNQNPSLANSSRIMPSRIRQNNAAATF
jgi:hypothetical protein